MKDEEKTKEQLINELVELRKQILELKKSETERIQAEEALRESEEKFRNLAEHSPNMIFINKKGRIVYANKICEEIMGYKRKEFYSPDFDFRILIPPESIDLVEKNFRRYMKGKDIPPYEYKLLTREGKKIDAIHTTKLINYEGESAILGIITDVTERKRAETEVGLLLTITRVISESRDFNSALKITLRKICEVIGWNYGEVWIPCPDETFLECGPPWYSSTRSLEKFRLLSEKITFPPNVGLPGRVWSSKQPEWIQNVSIQPDTFFIRARIARESGLKAAFGVPIIDNDQVLAVLAFFKISEPRAEDKRLVELVLAVIAQLGSLIQRKQSEEALAEMALFPELNPAPVLRTDYDGNILLANQGAHRLCSTKKLLGKSWYTLCPELDREAFEGLIHCQDTAQHECRIGERNFLFTYLSSSERRQVYIYGADITQLKNLEKQLRQTQKMEALGHLAGGVAHDFNTLLGIILGYGDMIKDDVPENSLTRDNTEELMEAVYRAKDLIKQLMDFSRPGEEERKPVQLVSIIKESVKLLRASLPTTINIHQNIAAESGTVLAHSSGIQQVIMNLGMNAGDAIGEKIGELGISLVEVEVDAELAGLKEVQQGHYLRLTVSDTGCGLEPEVLEHIFEPFFTTKDVGNGSGLGLSVVHGIIKSHGGFITVHTEPGKGCWFHIYLPRVED
ncbi:MAG: PAS domain S-box protein [Planctomycetes bacterium]|nr:PAS domain S-box protein [Planctomycetota bacterium]